MELEDNSLFTSHLFFVVSVHEKSQRRAVRAGGWFNHIRHKLMLRLFVEVFKRFATVLRVLFQVIIGPVGDSFQLAPSHGEQVFDVHAALGIVGQFVFLMFTQPDVLFADAIFFIPGKPLIDPSLVPFLVRTRHNKELDFHLLELARTKSKVARGDFVAKGLTDLRDSER